MWNKGITKRKNLVSRILTRHLMNFSIKNKEKNLLKFVECKNISDNRWGRNLWNFSQRSSIRKFRNQIHPSSRFCVEKIRLDGKRLEHCVRRERRGQLTRRIDVTGRAYSHVAQLYGAYNSRAIFINQNVQHVLSKHR